MCVCAGPFECKVVSDNGTELIKTKKSPPAPPGRAFPGHPPPISLTASVLPPTVPTIIPEEEDNGGVLTRVG